VSDQQDSLERFTLTFKALHRGGNGRAAGGRGTRLEQLRQAVPRKS
jgi:hypothetical protein